MIQCQRIEAAMNRLILTFPRSYIGFTAPKSDHLSPLFSARICRLGVGRSLLLSHDICAPQSNCCFQAKIVKKKKKEIPTFEKIKSIFKVFWMKCILNVAPDNFLQQDELFCLFFQCFFADIHFGCPVKYLGDPRMENTRFSFEVSQKWRL